MLYSREFGKLFFLKHWVLIFQDRFAFGSLSFLGCGLTAGLDGLNFRRQLLPMIRRRLSKIPRAKDIPWVLGHWVLYFLHAQGALSVIGHVFFHSLASRSALCMSHWPRSNPFLNFWFQHEWTLHQALQCAALSSGSGQHLTAIAAFNGSHAPIHPPPQLRMPEVSLRLRGSSGQWILADGDTRDQVLPLWSSKFFLSGLRVLRPR